MQAAIKTDNEHFACTVPQALRDKLLEVITTIKDDFISDCGQGEAYGCERLEPIYGVSYPGFIPFQDGGYEISDFYRNDTDSSYHITKAQGESVEKHNEYMYECFARDYKTEIENHNIKLEKGWCHSDLDSAPDLQSKFEDYECNWHEPALLRCELWLDRKDSKPVYCRVSLGYTDAPYYRSKHDETLFEFNVSEKTFLKAKPEAFVTMLKKKMAKVD